jgi:FkbM family methyltransferase
MRFPDGFFYAVKPNYEPETRRLISLLRGCLFVDVGAHAGVYSILAGKNGNKVIALEPDPRTFRCLRENLVMNRVDAETYPYAAWREDGFVDLEFGKQSSLTRTKVGTSVRAVTLDTILGGRIPDLVKIDVEDSELEVLKGMTKTLKAATHMKVVYEALGKEHSANAKEFLQRFDYTSELLERWGSASMPEWGNYVAQKAPLKGIRSSTD